MTFSREPISGRVLVFVVAYQAERHLRTIFERIPLELLNHDQVDFLCIDDASSDAGAAELSRWIQEREISNVTVLRNPVNQGYGGNQKLGYRAAIDGGYDFVILLHGDGQYAPELLPQFIRARQQQQADVVLGSRMMDIRSARQGGMPLYKRMGNRLLTWLQNRLTGLELSEYHTGYRGYATGFLQQIPFETNTNDFHFDTQILLQAAYVGARIVEFPIPTHYGDEICHVSGLKYAKDVVVSTVQYKLHRMGMACSLKYRHLGPTRYQDKTQMLYTSHTRALKIVEREAPKKVLDVGCGPGFVARQCEQMGASVTGIDKQQPVLAMSAFQQLDLERDSLSTSIFDFDVVLLLDVIEHLEDPERFLLRLRNESQVSGGAETAPLVIVSTPNIAFVAIRLNLLMGRFNYAERGILDITHKRLFTRRSLRQTLDECGYVVERMRPLGAPFQVVMPGTTGRVLGVLGSAFAYLWPTMFAFQFILECRPRPGVRQLLSQAQAFAGSDASSVEVPSTSATEPR